MKGSSTCRICGRWMEAAYVEDPERVQRETSQGHCDGCVPTDRNRVERVLVQLFPDRYGSRTGRLVFRLGDRLESTACRAQGIDPLESDEPCTGLWRHVENLGLRMKEWHRMRVSL